MKKVLTWRKKCDKLLQVLRESFLNEPIGRQKSIGISIR
jgi:hypothetical protein